MIPSDKERSLDRDSVNLIRRVLETEDEPNVQPRGCGRSRAAAKLGLRPLSASCTEDPFGDLSDPLVRGLAPDPVSRWKRWIR